LQQREQNATELTPPRRSSHHCSNHKPPWNLPKAKVWEKP